MGKTKIGTKVTVINLRGEVTKIISDQEVIVKLEGLDTSIHANISQLMINLEEQ